MLSAVLHYFHITYSKNNYNNSQVILRQYCNKHCGIDRIYVLCSSGFNLSNNKNIQHSKYSMNKQSTLNILYVFTVYLLIS